MENVQDFTVKCHFKEYPMQFSTNNHVTLHWRDSSMCHMNIYEFLPQALFVDWIMGSDLVASRATFEKCWYQVPRSKSIFQTQNDQSYRFRVLFGELMPSSSIFWLQELEKVVTKTLLGTNYCNISDSQPTLGGQCINLGDRSAMCQHRCPFFWGVVREGPNLIGLYTRIKRNLWLMYMKYRYSVLCRHRYYP